MTLEKVVKGMNKEGYSDKEIKERLTKQVFEGFGYSEERIEEIKEGVSHEATSDPTDEYEWVAVGF